MKRSDSTFDFTAIFDDSRFTVKCSAPCPYDALLWFVDHATGRLSSNSDFPREKLSACMVMVYSEGLCFGGYLFDGHSLILS